MNNAVMITRILVCGKTPEQTDAYTSAERALMENIVAGRSDLSEDCKITTMHGRELPDQNNKAAVEAFVWGMLDRWDLRGQEYKTEFKSHDGYSFLVIYILSESADSNEVDTDYAAEQTDDYQYDMLTIEMLKETAVCSDRECPCPETRIPEGTGYLYINPEAVTRMTALNEGKTGGSIGFGLMPVLVCEQGAKLRGLDLKVAAEDAKRWWKTGKVSLRPTPMAKSAEADTFVEETEQEEDEAESSPQPAGGKTDNPLGIEFKQEAYDLVARMEKLNAEKDKDAVYKAGDKVKIYMPLAGIPKPEETGLPHEVIMDEGHTGVILRSAGEEMVTVRWDAGKYRIHKDLDLATMKYLDSGSLKSEGFESEIHTSYLEKIKEGKTAITGEGLPSRKSEQAKDEAESSPQPAGGKKDNPLGIEFKQEAYDLVARMEKLNAEKDKDAVFKAGDRVKIYMPLAGIPKPEETGLPHEVIMDEGHTGVILRSAGEEMVAVKWDAGKYRIYRDLDLATMKYLDNGSLKSEGFESEIHTSYLEKIKEEKTAVTGQNLLSGKSEQASAPPQKKSSLKDLNHQAFYEEAETVEVAREKILPLIPDGHKILVEKITDANREYKLRVHGRNADKCQEMADKLLPASITVIKRNTLNQYRKFKKNVTAFTVDEAMQLVIKDEEFITVSSLVVTSKGKSGLFGLIKNPDQYEAELEQDEIIEITYKPLHSAVYIRTGPKATIPSSLTEYEDLPEVLWSCTQITFDFKGVDLSLSTATLLSEQGLWKILEKKTVNEFIEEYDKNAEKLYLFELLRFTGEIYDRKMTYADYEPVCFYLVHYYRNRLLPKIMKIKNGERVVFDLPLYNTFGVDRLFGHYEKWQLDIIKPALAVSFKVFENFLSLRLWS